MTKSAKELTFLRDLYVATDWTERFTNIFDENFKFSKEKQVLYLNAGTGNHALALCNKFKQKKEIQAVCENKELVAIAKAKADIIKANIEFTTNPPTPSFDLVLADASLTLPLEINGLIETMVAHSSKEIVFFLPTAGSFGEIFSLLWETFFNLNLIEKGAEIERLVSELPTVSALEEKMQAVGFQEITSVTKNESFEFKDGAEFINSPLMADFLLPTWLNFLPKNEQRKVMKNLAQVIDRENQNLTFQFSVKATFLRASKA